MNVSGQPFAHTTVGGTDVGFWIISALTLGLIGVALLWLKRRGVW